MPSPPTDDPGRGPGADGALSGNRRGRETRRRILEAATVCFQEQGMALTLDVVAEAAGITRMTVHRHTGGREALITHLVLRESAQLAEGLRTVLDGEGPFGRRLVDALVLAVETVRRAGHLQDLFTGRTPTAAAWPAMDPDEQVVDAIRGFFEPYFTEAAERGLLRVDADETLHWVLSQALLYLVMPTTAPDAATVRSKLEMFVLPAILTV